MSLPVAAAPADPLLDVGAYAARLESWLASRPAAVTAVTMPHPAYAERVEAMTELMAALFDAGWARFGRPEGLGGLGGTIFHRAGRCKYSAASDSPPSTTTINLHSRVPGRGCRRRGGVPRLGRGRLHHRRDSRHRRRRRRQALDKGGDAAC